MLAKPEPFSFTSPSIQGSGGGREGKEGRMTAFGLRGKQRGWG